MIIVTIMVIITKNCTFINKLKLPKDVYKINKIY